MPVRAARLKTCLSRMHFLLVPLQLPLVGRDPPAGVAGDAGRVLVPVVGQEGGAPVGELHTAAGAVVELVWHL